MTATGNQWKLESEISRSTGTVPLRLDGTPVTAAQVGDTANFTITATHGTAPYTYAVSSGTLPTGQSLNASTGAITGTLSAAATFSSIILKVTDNVGGVAFLASYNVVVTAPAADFTVTGTPTTTGTTGSAITPFVFTAVGATGALTWTFDTPYPAPTGVAIALNTSTTAIVSGTPGATADGTYRLRAKCVDSLGGIGYSALYQMVVHKAGAYVVIEPTPAYTIYTGPTIANGSVYDAHGKTFYMSASANPDVYGAESYPIYNGHPAAVPGEPAAVPKNMNGATNAGFCVRPQGSSSSEWRGGRMVGRHPIDVDIAVYQERNYASTPPYTGAQSGDRPYINNGGLLMDHAANVGGLYKQYVSRYRSHQCWDAIRFAFYLSGFSTPPGTCINYVDGCWISEALDDLIENDHPTGNVFTDCLFEKFQTFISCTSPLASEDHSVLDTHVLTNCILHQYPRVQNYHTGSYPDYGGFTTLDSTAGTWIKCPYKGVRNPLSPGMSWQNVTWAITGTFPPSSISALTGSCRDAWVTMWQRLVDLGGNRLLYLSGDTMPGVDYIGTIPAGITQVTGAAAVAEWASTRSTWLAAHPYIYRTDTDTE